MDPLEETLRAERRHELPGDQMTELIAGLLAALAVTAVVIVLLCFNLGIILLYSSFIGITMYPDEKYQKFSKMGFFERFRRYGHHPLWQLFFENWNLDHGLRGYYAAGAALLITGILSVIIAVLLF